MLFALVVTIAWCIPLACKRTSIEKQHEQISAASIAQLEKWWVNLKARKSETAEILSRIPAGMTIQEYWRSQFQNGVPKWNSATVYTLNGETVYEVPFEFPDNIIMMDQKPDGNVQPFISAYGSPGKSGKPSQSHLVVKPQASHDTLAEIMTVVLQDDFIEQLDSIGANYPFLHINHVYPSTSNTVFFTGSVKFFDLDGVQKLQQGYSNGALIDYLAYGKVPSAFSMTHQPLFNMMRSYQVCTYTYVYQQNCSPDAGCTDWILIGVYFNGCETIVLPSSPPAMPPTTGTSTGGGGGIFVSPPVIQPQEPIPNAKLCGGYKWTMVGSAHYTQIRNFGAMFVKTGSTISPQHVVLGLTCIEIPKQYSNQGHDITGFVNYAYNKTVDIILDELDRNALPGGSSFIELRFKALFRKYLVEQPNVNVWGATATFHNGCLGTPGVGVSEPKYCAPI